MRRIDRPNPQNSLERADIWKDRSGSYVRPDRMDLSHAMNLLSYIRVWSGVFHQNEIKLLRKDISNPRLAASHRRLTNRLAEIRRQQPRAYVETAPLVISLKARIKELRT